MDRITPSAGLKLEPDSAPYTDRSMDLAPALIDTTLYTAISGEWLADYSYGIDLGSSGDVDVLRVYFECYDLFGSGPMTPTGWSGTVTFKVYKSDDGSNWTWVEDFVNPVIQHMALGEMYVDLAFAATQTARFFKAVSETYVGVT